MLLNVLEDSSQRLGHWPATETGGGWYMAQLKNNSTIAPSHGADADDEN